MSRQTDITVRLSAKGAEDVKRALERMGTEGQRALRQIEQASKSARPEAKALAVAMDDINGRVGGLGRDIPGVSAALGGLGPMGAAAATGLGLVAAAAGAVIAQTGPMMEWAATLTDTAQALDVSTDALQFWRFALEEAGGSAEDADSGLAALNSTIGALRTGLGDTRVLEALKELKLDPALLQGAVDTEAALQLLIEAFEGVKSEADRTRIAQRLNLEALLPVFRLTSEEIQRLEAYFESLGINIEQGVIKALDEAHREMEIASQQMRANLAPASLELARAFADIAPHIATLIGWLADFIGWIGDTIEWLDRLGRSLVEVGELQSQVANARYGPPTDPQAAAGPVVIAPRSAGGRGRRGSAVEQARTAEILGENQGSQMRRPPPAPPATARRSGGSGRAGRAAPRDTSAEDAARDAAANEAALNRAILEELQLKLAMARTDEERFRLRREILEEENRQALAAIAANKQMRAETQERQRQVVAARRLAGLAEVEADEAEAALEAGRRRKEASEAEFRKAQEARARADEARAREAEVLADAAMLEAQTARDIAETREQQKAAELAILDLVTQRQLAEIELLKVSEEAKQRARAAVLRDRDAQARRIEDRARGGADAYLAGLQREARTLNDVLNDIVEDGLRSFEDALVDIGTGAEDAEEAFRKMAQGILADLIRLAARQWVILPLMQMMGLGGEQGSGPRQSSGMGGAASIGSWVAAFTRASSSASKGESGGGSASNFVWQLLPNILRFNGGFGGGRASGGPVDAGRMYLTGERGPELIVPRSAGYVLTAARTQQLLSGSVAGSMAGGGGGMGGVSLAVHVHNAPPGTQVRPRADGGADVIIPRLEAVEQRVGRLDSRFEERTLTTVAEANRRGFL